ncbi:beta-N-acetylglucosaminidase domain-containing protein [Clostridium sp.]|uniref:beta-N-acetylglucosaminidase domain-containing protein n=1 Tax=Clostridium sp. TaxID=1506 RepID=UPI0025C0D24E|nr:beta-N-acetylglucosaminidase domain-containing protein [Clostridium sp.]
MRKRIQDCKNRLISLTLSITILLGICFQSTEFKVRAIENENVNSGTADESDKYLIYPIPQSILYDEDKTSFNLKNGINLVLEDGIDEATKLYVEEVLTEFEINYTINDKLSENITNLCLGVNNSKGIVDEYVKNNITISSKTLFENPDSYLMDVREEAIVILGKDTDSTFYGVATLKMLFSSFNNIKLLNAKIEDYASVPVRGFIEGFYGGWNYEERESLMNFAKDYKMNSFIYASKTDPYHTSKWDVLYPADELTKIEELVNIGEKTKVRYGWSVHISGFFSGLDTSNKVEYEKRYEKLISKFQQLYDVGVRKFDVLNDDFGSGSNEDVVALLNRLDTEFIQKNGCYRMAYCPQGYNKAWSGNGEELRVLNGLNETIDLYWTGDDVNSPITQETVNFLKGKTNHKPMFWLNYPVNEHSKSGIYLGDISYYARDNVNGMAGFVSNPSRFAESNKVALFQLAALNWNNKNYLSNSQKVWEDSFKYIQPEVNEAYLTIARNIANAPRSSRVPGFNESEYLKTKLDSVANKIQKGTLTAEDEDIVELIEEFDKMLVSIEEMRNNCTNDGLIEELDPWLKSLKDVATSGKEILKSKIAILNNNKTEAWNSFRIATKAFETKYTYLTTESLPNVYAEAGSKRLTPFISKVVKSVKNDIVSIFGIEDDSFTPSIYAVMGGVEQVDNANTAKIFDGDESTNASFIVNQAEGDYIGVDMGKNISVKNIHILQAMNDTHHDYFHEAVLEYSTDGTTWNKINTYNNQVRIDLDDLNFEARYVRLRLIKDKTKPYWTYIREFNINKEEPKQPRIYTNVEALKETPITINGGRNSIYNLNNINLQPNEYVGIKLIDISKVSNLVNKASKEGLTVEYSINGSTWDEFIDETVNSKYIRLINKSNSNITLNINEFGISITNLKVNPNIMETNLTNGLKEGSYKNLFDNDYSTFAWTNENQAIGDYITFDLGNTSNIYDVKVITSDGNPRLYNAEIQISKDNKEWTSIGNVINDNSVFEVPYRYVSANGEGKEARYLRIYITGNSGYYLKLNEIEINKSVENQILSDLNSSLKGNVSKVIDKDISTVFTQEGPVSKTDYIEYIFSENANVDNILLLQEPSNGVMKINTKNGYVDVSNLNSTIIDVDTSKYGDILSVRLEWEDGENPSIYELMFKYGENTSDDIGVNVDNIIVEGPEDEITNIALRKPVTVSGTSDGNKDFVNDGDDKTKWDSNFIKGNNASKNAWITIDLGEDRNEITQLIVKYFNKIYPTNYDVQISNDNENWETIKEIQKPHNGPTYPIDSIDFETPISARYLRLFFKELNTGAAGNGVGISELMIMGRYIEEIPVDYSILNSLINEVKEKDLSNYTTTSVNNLSTTLKEAELLLENKEVTQEQINKVVEKLEESINALEVKITESLNVALNKKVEVSGTSNGLKNYINDGDKLTKWDSNFIKGDNSDENAWIIVDLGEKQVIIKEFIISYFNLVFPTKYTVQISSDMEEWVTVVEKNKEHGSEAHPIDTIKLDNEVSARYVRFMFEELNSEAVGRGVGINELEIIGKTINEESEIIGVQDYEDKEVIIPTNIDSIKLDKMSKVSVKLEELVLELLVPVIWDINGFDGNTPGVYNLLGELKLNDNIKNPKTIKAKQRVILKEDNSGPGETVDKTNLEAKIDDLENVVTNIDKYIPETVEGIRELLEEAKGIYNSKEVTQEIIDDICEKISKAMDNAKLKEDNPDPGETVDKTNLEAKINDLENVVTNIDKYIPETVEGIRELLEEAKGIYNSKEVTQENIDDICEKISKAMDNAKLKEENNNSKPDEENNNKPSDSSNIKESEELPKTGSEFNEIVLFGLLFSFAGIILILKRK